MISGDTPSPRSLTEHEQELWRAITRTVAPLKPRRLPSRQESTVAPERKKKTVASTPGHPTPVRVVKAPKGPPPLLPIDRRTRQRLARGTETIAARIDLHGRTQGEAHEALLRFLHRAQRNGDRIVLVITGKGGGSVGEFGGSRGVLKRHVPLWLGLPEFRIYVSGFDPAQPEHGGEGALYVRLRRQR
jgi:DNA-nicking Smr family endonuclease